MSRVIPPNAEAFFEQSGVVWLPFLELSHPKLQPSIRVVSDLVEYQWNGYNWLAYPFGFKRLSDDDSNPQTRLTIMNIDRKIGNVLRKASGTVNVSMWIITSAEFDLTQDPRTPIGTPNPIYSYSAFDLTNVEIDPVKITGKVSRRDYSVEPWPGMRATQDKFPGLFV